MNPFKTFYSATRIIALTAAWLCCGSVSAHASNVPAGFTETVVPGPFAGLWGKPVGSTFDATGRMFVWERLGRIWVKGPTETNFTQLLSIEEEEGTDRGQQPRAHLPMLRRCIHAGRAAGSWQERAVTAPAGSVLGWWCG